MAPTDAPRRSALVALFLFGLLPYVSTVKWPPVASFWAEWMSALLATGIAVVALRRTAGTPPSSTPLAALACIATALVIAIQLICGQPNFRGQAVIAIAALGLAAAISIGAAGLRARGNLSRELQAWSWGLLVGLVLNGAEALAERNGWQVYLYQLVPSGVPPRLNGLIGQPNQLAAFAVMAWGAALFLWMRERLGGTVLLGVAAVVGLISAGAGSRAGTILLLAVTLLGWLVLRTNVRRQMGQRLLLASIAMFVAFQAWWSLTDTGAAQSALRSEALGRVELLRDGVELIKLHPLQGVGFGNFLAARWQQLSAPMMEPLAGHAHNAIVQLAAELGVVAALLILAPLTWVVLKGLRNALRRDATPEQFFVAAIVLVLSGYSLVEFPLWYGFFLFPFAFALGLIEQPGIRLGSVNDKPSSLLRNGAWGLTVVALAALAWDYRRTEAVYVDAAMRQSSVAAGDMTPPLPTREIRQIALLTLFDRQIDLMQSRTLALNGMLVADKLPITERVMLSLPTWETIVRHMALLVIAGKTDEARRVWDRTGSNPQLRYETYAALRQQAPKVPGLAAFFTTLPEPAPPAAR